MLVLVLLVPQSALADRVSDALDFLKANRPSRDSALTDQFLLENIYLAYLALGQAPWGKDIPGDIFLNNVLPYATLNERRDNWRASFYRLFMPVARKYKSIDAAALALNKYVFKKLRVSYNADKRPKPDQSPYESMSAGYASCTGLSILLVDALRSVGIPARIAAIAMWKDNSGNHTWVEIWDGQWHYLGASESRTLDQAWFSAKAAETDAAHPIFASSFKKTARTFPMRWAPELTYVSAVDVTANYQKK